MNDNTKKKNATRGDNTVEEGPVIHVYTRFEALRDSVLVDVSVFAHMFGFRVPVAFTAAVWRWCLSNAKGVLRQDAGELLYDVLRKCHSAVRSRGLDTARITFDVIERFDTDRLRRVSLEAVCGPDDDGEPCVTIMFPRED